jgi:hypothetical protein
MTTTIVDKLYTEFTDIVSVLADKKEISLQSVLDDNFRKSLLLSAASYFEHRITTAVIEFCSEIAGANTLVPSLVRNKAVSRQYHTWFDWNKSNANSFFGLFGADFKSHMDALNKQDSVLVDAIKDFLDLGQARNRLVHENYGTFVLEKTSEEIYKQYQSAMLFIERLPVELRKCSAAAVAAEGG